MKPCSSRFLCCLVALFAGGARAEDKKYSRWITFKGADAVVVAKLDRVTPGGILLYLLPALYAAEARLIPEEVVRGPLRKGVPVEVYYNLRGMEPPVYPVGKTCLIALERDRQRNTWNVLLLEAANEENVKEAKAAQGKP